jgi:nickel superoxide dismutase
VIRMVQLIEGLQAPDPSGGKEAIDHYAQQMTRYTAVKEEHAKIAEHELIVLWTDYFKPEHLEKYPDLHDVFWKATKLTSTVKQQINMQASQDLLASCQRVAEMFWESKGVPTRRGPSNQTAGGEFVYPAS